MQPDSPQPGASEGRQPRLSGFLRGPASRAGPTQEGSRALASLLRLVVLRRLLPRSSHWARGERDVGSSQALDLTREEGGDGDGVEVSRAVSSCW